MSMLKENSLDATSFELLQQQSPTLLAAIQNAIKRGGTPKVIERRLKRQYGDGLTVQLAINAAHYLYNQRGKVAGDRAAARFLPVKEYREARASKGEAPYPWCLGNPTREDCVRAGYCRRDPNCGE